MYHVSTLPLGEQVPKTKVINHNLRNKNSPRTLINSAWQSITTSY